MTGVSMRSESGGHLKAIDGGGGVDTTDLCPIPQP